MKAHPCALFLLLAWSCLGLGNELAQECAPGCLPLSHDTYTNNSVLDSGVCYFVFSVSSTSSRSVLSPLRLAVSSDNATTTIWRGQPPGQPVLDLCNQVQSIWLAPGEWPAALTMLELVHGVVGDTTTTTDRLIEILL